VTEPEPWRNQNFDGMRGRGMLEHGMQWSYTETDSLLCGKDLAQRIVHERLKGHDDLDGLR